MGRLGFVSTAGVVAALLFGAAGCGGEPEPKFAPEPTASASGSVGGSPSASPTGSAAPEPLDREETVRAWVKARNEALQDGDTGGMRALSAPQCRGCANFTTGIEDVFSAGGSYDTPGWSVRKLLAVAPNIIDVRVNAAAGSTITEAGSEPVFYDAQIRDLRFSLHRAEGKWAVANIVFLAP